MTRTPTVPRKLMVVQLASAEIVDAWLNGGHSFAALSVMLQIERMGMAMELRITEPIKQRLNRERKAA